MPGIRRTKRHRQSESNQAILHAGHTNCIAMNDKPSAVLSKAVCKLRGQPERGQSESGLEAIKPVSVAHLVQASNTRFQQQSRCKSPARAPERQTSAQEQIDVPLRYTAKNVYTAKNCKERVHCKERIYCKEPLHCKEPLGRAWSKVCSIEVYSIAV